MAYKRAAVDDAYCAILDDWGYHREGCWHDPDSALEAAEMEGWVDAPETAPGACMTCFAVTCPPFQPKCDCGGEIKAFMDLMGETGG